MLFSLAKATALLLLVTEHVSSHPGPGNITGPLNPAAQVNAEKGNFKRPLKASKGGDLYEMVKKSFLDRLPNTIHPFLKPQNKSWIVKEARWVTSDLLLMEIYRLQAGSCKPVIRNATQLATGIWCNTSGGCTYSKRLVATKSYENTAGASFSVSETMTDNDVIFEASMAMTAEAHWQNTWTSGQEEDDQYEFVLRNGDACIPVMMHVELECQLAPDTYWWDSYARMGVELRPEWNFNRKGGIWRGGQYCHEQITDNDTTLNESWMPLIPSDLGRGYAWTGESSAWLSNSSSDAIPHDSLVIRRKDGDQNPNASELIICDPARTTAPMRATVPYSIDGKLPGYIACVSQ